MSLQVSRLSKAFKSEQVIDDVSLDIATGETLVLFGPSGAGKTVLLRLIAGVIDPDAGAIAIGGADMEGVEPEERGIGMAFQNFALFPHMDAHANIASPLTARRETAAGIKERVGEVARLLKIDHVLGHLPKALSNGQKQRTALGRALVAQPSILLLDDPLRNVDAKLRFEMRLELPRLLKEQRATVIYVTQDYKEAMALGDRIAVMRDGAIAQLGTPEDVYLRPASTEIARLFGDPAINLLEVTPALGTHGPTVRVSGTELALAPGFDSAVGQACTLGVRPEAIRFVDADSPGAIPVTVEAETPLNEKTVTLVLSEQQREIVVSRPSGTPGPAEGRSHIALDLASALLFDRGTGARLNPVSQSAARQGEPV
ncbi:MAG: ABC transporter ATP-binding protein [Pseudomonadota bacterium]